MLVVLLLLLSALLCGCYARREPVAPTENPLNKTLKAAQVECREVVRMGNLQAGGWDVCISELNQDSVVYSFGIDKDLSFELDLVAKLELRHVHAFDPTPYAKDWIVNAVKFHRLPDGLFYHDVALSKVDGRLTMFRYGASKEHTAHVLPDATVTDTATFRAARLKSIMRDLGHLHVDLLKIDIEGGEWPVLADIVHVPVLFSQLLVEFHHFDANHDINQVVFALNALGFKVFSLGERLLIDGKFFQEIGFIYTKHDTDPIRPEIEEPPATLSPEELRQQRLQANRWSFSSREQDRDKSLRDREASRLGDPKPVLERWVNKHEVETVFDRRAKAQEEADARIAAKYGPEAQLLREKQRELQESRAAAAAVE